jgi:hypothetical protein
MVQFLLIPAAHASGRRAKSSGSTLYAVFFNSTLYTVAAEIFPQHLRGYGTGIAALCQGVSGI